LVQGIVEFLDHLTEKCARGESGLILDGIVKRLIGGSSDFHIDGMIQGERVAGCEGRRIVDLLHRCDDRHKHVCTHKR